MRKGKMVAQGAHASMAVLLDLMKDKQPWWKKILSVLFEWPSTTGLDDPRVKPWVDGSFKKICVYVNSEEELLAIHQKAKDANVLTALIRDNGLTEFGGVPTYTCAAIGPDTNENINALTFNLPLL